MFLNKIYFFIFLDINGLFLNMFHFLISCSFSLKMAFLSNLFFSFFIFKVTLICVCVLWFRNGQSWFSNNQNCNMLEERGATCKSIFRFGHFHRNDTNY